MQSYMPKLMWAVILSIFKNLLLVYWNNTCEKMACVHLVSFAVAKPAAPFDDIVERKVIALSHPIPIASRLHQTRFERQVASLLLPDAVGVVESAAIVPAVCPGTT